MFWSIVAWFLAPLGFLACVLMLSGNTRLEKWGGQICSSTISLGSMSIRLDRICILLSVITFAAETFKLTTTHPVVSNLEIQDRYQMNKLRHERNFWISLYMITLWFVAGRVAYLRDLVRSDRPKWK